MDGPAPSTKAMEFRNLFFTYSFAVLLFSKYLLGSYEEKGTGSDFCPSIEFYSNSCNALQSTEEATEIPSHGSSDSVVNSYDGGLFHNGLSGLHQSLSWALGKAYKIAKRAGDKLYVKIKNSTMEFIEGMRQLLHEEFIYYFQTQSILSGIMAPGKLLELQMIPLLNWW